MQGDCAIQLTREQVETLAAALSFYHAESMAEGVDKLLDTAINAKEFRLVAKGSN